MASFHNSFVLPRALMCGAAYYAYHPLPSPYYPLPSPYHPLPSPYYPALQHCASHEARAVPPSPSPDQ